jgi:hypothetical protein
MRPVFILSGPASGVRELGDVLNGNGLACLASAFDIANPAEYGLGHFLRHCNVGAAELIAAPLQLLDDYLSHCAGLIRAERFCLEVHDDVMHIFNGGSWLLGQPPRLMGYIRERHYGVVHFSRRQPFVQALMRQMAEAGQARSPEVASASFALDIRRCEQQIRLLEQFDRLMAAWVRGYDGFQRLTYEAVFEAGMVSDSGARLLEAMFDKPIVNRAPRLPVEHHDFRHLVSNAGDVIAAFADGPLAAEVHAVLG